MGEDGILRTEDFRYRYDTVEGWEVGVTSYRLGDQFFCSVDNVSPGARLARARGTSREEAEDQAMKAAGRLLNRTRVNSLD